MERRTNDEEETRKDEDEEQITQVCKRGILKMEFPRILIESYL